jgi:hypothetical protein
MNITTERLDCIIRRLEIQGPHSDHLMYEPDYHDTLAVLRAYRETLKPAQETNNAAAAAGEG